MSQHAMPYCAEHNRLYPHYAIGWLTPAGTQGLHLLAAQCPTCLQSDSKAISLRYCNGIITIDTVREKGP